MSMPPPSLRHLLAAERGRSACRRCGRRCRTRSRWPARGASSPGYRAEQPRRFRRESTRRPRSPSWMPTRRGLRADSSRGACRPGTRLALLVRPGIEFVTLVFALLRAGMVIVLVDPGLGAAKSHSLLAGGGAGRVRRDRRGPGGPPVSAAQVSARAVECDGRPAVVLGRADAWTNCGHAATPELPATRCRCPLHRPTIRRRSFSRPAARGRRRACSTRIGCSTRRWPRFSRRTASSRAASIWRAFRCSHCSTRRWA